MRRTWFLAALTAALVARPEAAWAGPFTFTNVIDTTAAAPNGTYTYLNGASLSGGSVGLIGFYSGGTALLAGAPGSVAVVAQTGMALSIGTLLDMQGYSFANGTMTFRGGSATGTGIFAAKDGVVSTIVQGLYGELLGGCNHTSTDGATTTFSCGTGPAGLLASNNGNLTVLAQPGNALPGGLLAGTHWSSIDGDTAAFEALLFGDIVGIFTVKDGTFTKIVATGDAAPLGTFTGAYAPHQSGGVTSFLGTYGDGTTNEIGIFTGAGGAVTTIAKTGDTISGITLTSFGEASLNNGRVAFTASGVGGNGGVFVSQNGTVIDAILSGSTLFGSTVMGAQVNRESLDADGSFAFQYELADGRVGIAIASPTDVGQVPEPSTWAMFAIGLAGIATLRLHTRLGVSVRNSK